MARRKKSAPAPTRTAKPRRKGIEGIPTDLPGTEQHTDEVLERQWLDRKQAMADAADAKDRKATAEANIQRRFEEIAEADPEDPRAKAYRVADGDTLYPRTKPVLKVKRAPSRQAKAEAAVRSVAATATPVPEEIPDLPDEDEPTDDDAA